MITIWERLCVWRFEVAAERFARSQSAHEALGNGANGWSGASEAMNTLDLVKIFALGDMLKWSRRAYGPETRLDDQPRNE